jgi:hypothetical protein
VHVALLDVEPQCPDPIEARAHRLQSDGRF